MGQKAPSSFDLPIPPATIDKYFDIFYSGHSKKSIVIMSQPPSCGLTYPVGMPPYGVLAACSVTNVIIEASESSKMKKNDPICLTIDDW